MSAHISDMLVQSSYFLKTVTYPLSNPEDFNSEE